MGQPTRVLVEEGEERTRDPLEDAKGQLKDPHRSALGEERQVLLHSRNSLHGFMGSDGTSSHMSKEGRGPQTVSMLNGC